MGNLTTSLNRFDTLPKQVEYLAENYPEKELFVFYRGENRDSYTSQQLFQLAGKFAYRLRYRYGFKRNDIIANTLPNSPERVITDLGITLAGCISMNGQILLADGSDFILSAQNSRCSGVVLRPEDCASAWQLLKHFVKKDSLPDVLQLSCDKAPDMKLAIPVSRRLDNHRKPFLEDLRSSKEEILVDPTISAEDLLVIFTTSGSTGYSKLVPRTNAEIISLSSAMQDSVKVAVELQHDILYSDRLLGWPGGYPINVYCQGQKRVMQDFYDGPGKKGGEYTWKAICEEKCNISFIFPLELDSILKYISTVGGCDYKLNALGTGAQPLRKSQVASMFTIAKQVFVGYGLTEVAPVSMGIILSPDFDDFFCGKPTREVQLKVIDENGSECKPRQTGTILVKAPNTFKGYFNRLQDPDPNTVKCFTKDGWYDTEDLGFLDEEGNVYVIGRNKDTIIYGSSVFYPGWLEAKILQHPDIVEARIVPVSDPVLYHNICVCVKPVSGSDLTEEKLKKYCESLFIADLDSALTPMPKYFMVLENFPETATGKPDKQALIKMAEKCFGSKIGKF